MDFSGYQYPSDIILQAVRYYVSYKLSTRDIEEIFTERVLLTIPQSTVGLLFLRLC
uniref:Transposase-like protein n=1 Tax=Aliivibrio fischeri TaxID=668 RepID=H2ES95_ALIFS|nr:Transposase-like protein [Aliivibrio fischeri]AEY78262.1 Transposase-like protein [Aliivibrio fischeri]AEY78276.1 Transposase-like protein [Aliivibrio fischeri]